MPLRSRLLLALAAATLAASCPCANNGTCNEVLRTCACPPSFAGPACETQLFPACRLTASPPAPPHWLPATGARCVHSEQPRSCACLRQCAAAGERLPRPLPEPESKRYDVEWLRCFERTGVAEADQLSDFPAEDEAAAWLEHHRPGAAALPRAKVTDVSSHGRLMPLAACPGSCSFEGACYAAPAGGNSSELVFRCRCYRGFAGGLCEVLDPAVCLNGCNGRGACVRGFCSCAPGWSGRDCSVEAAALRAALARSNVTRSATTLRIYIHQLPAWADVGVRADTAAKKSLDDAGIYAAYWRFLSRLSNDFEVRTLDPREASLFLVPADVFALTGNVGSDGLDFVRRVLDDLARTAEPAAAAALALRNGSDHMVWMPQDRGYCDQISAQPAWMRRMVWVTHYLPRRGKGATPQSEPCYDGVPSIVAPAMTPLLKHNTPEQCAQNFGDLGRRDIFFAFVGWLHPNKREYSGGVRQDVHAHYHNKPGYVIQVRASNYTEIMRHARFCLDPEGEGWSQRMLEAACIGCIPVTIQPSGTRAPADDVLPYWRFSVRLTLEDIPRMDAMLRAISDEEWLHMQRELQQHSASFWWRDDDAAGAYHLVLESLRRHAWQTAALYWK